MTSSLLPWQHEAIQALDLRAGSRVLQLTAHDTELARGLLAITGPQGAVVALEPSADRAAAVRDATGVDVVAIDPDGTETFGMFDAVIACPTWDPKWTIPRWGEIFRNSLRPGGKFVLDLPAESSSEALDAAWRRCSAPQAELERWHGVSESEAAEGLRDTGLRNVEGMVGVHLVRFESPFVFADFALGEDPDDALRETLGLALVEELRSNGEVETIFRRTHVHGMR